MSSTQVGNRSTFDLGGVSLAAPQAPAPAPVPVPVTPPPPPRTPITQQIKESFQRWKSTPVGEGITNWANAVGAVAGYVVPPVVLAGAGYLAGSMSGMYDGAASFAIAGAVAGAVASVGAQGHEALGNVTLYKREGHASPRLASFRDVMVYFTVPAAAVGLAAQAALGDISGLVAGAVAGGVGASIGLSVMNARRRRVY